MPQSAAARFGDSSEKNASAPLQPREWDHMPTVKFPIGAPPTPLPGNGLVRARARIPDARSSKPPSSTEQDVRKKNSSRPSLGSLNLLTPSDPTLPPRANAAKVSYPPPRSVSPRACRDWDGSVSVVQPIGSPASPLPEVSPQRDAVTFALWKILAGNNQDFLTSQDFHAGMQNVFPGERHIAIQELWATMARSLGGRVSQEQFQHFFEKSRPDFLFDQDRRHRLLQPYMRPLSSLSYQSTQKHGPWIDLPKGHVSEREGRSISPRPPHAQLFLYYNQDGAQDFTPAAPAASPRRVPADELPNSAPVTPADASARARQRILHNTDRAKVSQAPDSAGFKAVILQSSRASHATTPLHSKSKRDKASSPKELKAARDLIRLQQYLTWMRTVLPSEDCESIGSDGSGLCNGLLLFKLIKALGAPADRLQSLHLQMDQGVRTRRLWLRNMEAIGNCVHACSSSICVLDPELAVDGDAGALVSLLRLIVQTFIVKKIPKSRVIEWCAAHLQFFNMTLQPQTVHFPHSNTTLQQDFGDGLLVSLLLQRCIPAAGEAAGSEAMLLLQESELHSESYSNRHIALGLIITLGLPPYFNMQQLDLKPLEHNFLWMQLHAIYLAFSSTLPAPSATAAIVESETSCATLDLHAITSSSKETSLERKVALEEKRVLEAKSAELQLSVQRLDNMKRTLRVLASPRSPRPSEILQQVKKTQAQLQERSQELEDTSYEISTVKQALAAVMQQQQEVQSLVQEHNALQAAHDSKESRGDSQSARTIQSFLEKVQRATLLEASYTHRSKLLRAAAESLAPALDRRSPIIPPNPELQESIEQAEADLREIEQFFLQQDGAQLSDSSKLLVHAKRCQLQELQIQNRGRLQPEVLDNIQTLLSSDRSLQDALDREAHIAFELQHLKQEGGTPASRLQQRTTSVSKTSRSGKVQFCDTGQHDESSGVDLQIKVQSAELNAIQRLIQSKQKDDADAVLALKEILLRKQTRLSSLSSRYLSSTQTHNASTSFQRSNEECFSLFIVNKGENSSSAADTAAWRLFWQSLHVHFTVEIMCGASHGCDADITVENAMAQVAAAMERSQAPRKFVFLFVCGPVAESDPRALQLHDGQRVTFDRLHGWLGSLSQHECMVVFDTGGSAFAQTALDASCVNSFSGSIISGCLGLVDAGVHCSASHPLHHGICSEMGLLSFTIIEALLSASTNLTCDELELLFSGIKTQQHLIPSIISTLPYIVPSWVMAIQSLQRNHRSRQQAPQSGNVHSSLAAAALRPDDIGTTYLSHALETQYPPVSPEDSPVQSADEMEPGLFHAPPDFSDDDDVRPDAAWRFEDF